MTDKTQAMDRLIEQDADLIELPAMTDVESIAKGLTEGWKHLLNARKWHYFGSDGRSLCKSWLTLSLSGFEQGNDDSPDNCTKCRRILLSRNTWNAERALNGAIRLLHDSQQPAQSRDQGAHLATVASKTQKI